MLNSDPVDESYRMLAAMLMATSTKFSMTQRLTELHNSLSTQMEDPYIRAIMVWLSTDDWSEVIDEAGMSLRDRVVLALQKLPDEKLLACLSNLARLAALNGSLDAILLLGFSPAYVGILEKHVDKTGDFQLAALVSNFAPPREPDVRLDRWTSLYRDTLDRGRAFHARIAFDIARRERRTRWFPDRREIGADGEREPAFAEPVCSFCGKLLRPHLPSNTGGGGPKAGTNSRVSVKVGHCRHCTRALPRCCICLRTIGVPDDRRRDGIASHSELQGAFSLVTSF